MKINVITTEAGKIISRNTIIKLNVNPFDVEGTKVPISLYQKKGDLLVAKGYSNPAAIDVGSDGQVLVSDSTEAAGVRWKTMQLGTITLSNSESFAVPAGSVVTQGTESGTFRMGTSSDTANLYVASEDILPGEDGVLYATSGVSCSVRVTEGAIAIGDKLAVSAIDGIAQATTGDHFAIAVISKSAGQVGVVSCILANSNSSVLNAYPIGSIYMSVNPTNPSNYFGGTWVAWGTGRVPVGIDTSQTEFNTVEKTGGEKTHKLSMSEIPNATGYFTVHGAENGTDHWTCGGVFSGSGVISNKYTNHGSNKYTGANSLNPINFNLGGGGGAHNNLQPYITCYMWKRTG